METVCTFSITPLDRALLPQVQTLLAKRVELDSRRRLPKLWALTDRLNRAERAPQAVQVRRRRRRSILGVLYWALGLFLLLPGLMEPVSPGSPAHRGRRLWRGRCGPVAAQTHSAWYLESAPGRAAHLRWGQQ